MFYFFQASYASRSWWRSLKRSAHLPSSLNTALPSGQCKDIDRGSGSLPWWWSFGCRFLGLETASENYKESPWLPYQNCILRLFCFQICVYFLYLAWVYIKAIWLPHILSKCLVKPTPSKRYVHSTPSMCTKKSPPVLRRFKVTGVCFVNGKSCLDTWRPQLPDMCCVRSTVEQ